MRFDLSVTRGRTPAFAQMPMAIPFETVRGNAIAGYAVAEIEPARFRPARSKAFGEGDDFLAWMLSEGISERVARSVADHSAQLVEQSAGQLIAHALPHASLAICNALLGESICDCTNHDPQRAT